MTHIRMRAVWRLRGAASEDLGLQSDVSDMSEDDEDDCDHSDQASSESKPSMPEMHHHQHAAMAVEPQLGAMSMFNRLLQHKL